MPTLASLCLCIASVLMPALHLPPLQDQGPLQELLRPLEERGVLVKRSEEQLLRCARSCARACVCFKSVARCASCLQSCIFHFARLLDRTMALPRLTPP